MLVKNYKGEMKMAKEAYRIVNDNEETKEEVLAESEVKKSYDDACTLTYRCCGEVNGMPCNAIMKLVSQDSPKVKPYFCEAEIGKHLPFCRYNKEQENKNIAKFSKDPKKISLAEMAKKIFAITKINTKSGGGEDEGGSKKVAKGKLSENGDIYDTRDTVIRWKTPESLKAIYLTLINVSLDDLLGDSKTCGESLINSRNYESYRSGGKNKCDGYMLVVAGKSMNNKLNSKVIGEGSGFKWTLQDPYIEANAGAIYYVLEFPEKSVFYKVKGEKLDRLLGDGDILLVFCEWETFEIDELNGNVAYKGTINSDKQILIINKKDHAEDLNCMRRNSRNVYK